MTYDFLVVGAGLYGATFARLAAEKGKKVLVIDKRDIIGGTAATKLTNGINVHLHGAHIFHTDYDEVIEFVGRFAKFMPFVNSPIAKYKNEVYNLPFNMNTFSKIFNVSTPAEAKQVINEEISKAGITKIDNLRDQAISMVGTTIYEKLVQCYTEKQWGRKCEDLNPSIIKRLPLRFTYDNNYFTDKFQGIPVLGYTVMINNMLLHENIKVKLCTAFDHSMLTTAKKVIYTGSIDEYFDYKLGSLDYRSLIFRHECVFEDNVQGNAVVNYTDDTVPYTRSIEHKHFDKNCSSHNVSIVTYEYPKKYFAGDERYYPINDEKNRELYKSYLEMAKGSNVFFGGRLGKYRYFDMDDVIMEAMKDVNEQTS